MLLAIVPFMANFFTAIVLLRSVQHGDAKRTAFDREVPLLVSRHGARGFKNTKTDWRKSPFVDN